jgi:hypothetical protein
MPIFKFSACVTVSAFTIVEADTLEAALVKAEDRPVTIGGVNSGESRWESWIIDEADGDAQDIRVA